MLQSRSSPSTKVGLAWPTPRGSTPARSLVSRSKWPCRDGLRFFPTASRSRAFRVSRFMFSPSEYQLVDVGAGRKLERFGRYLIDRPAPAASGAAPADPA